MTGSGAGAGVRVRPWRPEDTTALYDVCLRTGDAGADASALTGDPTLLGDIYVGPYLAAAPELALVADDGDGPAGYALGVLDTAAFEDWCEREWWPAAQARHPVRADAGSYDREFLAVLADPALGRHPDLPGYPSHLHIDLLEHVRGGGLGRRMMQDLFALLAERGSPGVHLGVDVRNEGAQLFYARLGFTRLAPDVDGVRYLGLPLG